MKHIFNKTLCVAFVGMVLCSGVCAQGTIDLLNYSECSIKYYDWDYRTEDGQLYGWELSSRSEPDGTRHKILNSANASDIDPSTGISQMPSGETSALRLGTDMYNVTYDAYGNIVDSEMGKGGGVVFSYNVTQENAILFVKYATVLEDAMQDHINTLENLIGQTVYYLGTNLSIGDVAMFKYLSDWHYQQPLVHFSLAIDNSELGCTDRYQSLYDESGNQLKLTDVWQYNPSDDRGHPVYYKPWSLMTFDLTPYIGHNVSLVMEYYDCAQAGWFFFEDDKNDVYPQIYTCDDHHFARLYSHVSCSSNQLTLLEERCSPQPQVTYQAPDGFASYRWYSSQNTDLTLGTEQKCTYIYNGSEALDLCCEVTSVFACDPTVLKQHIVYCPANCVTPDLMLVEDLADGVTYKATDGFAYQWYTSKDPLQIISNEQTCTYIYNGNEELDLCCRLTAHSECSPVELRQHLISATVCDAYEACNGISYTASGNYDIACVVNESADVSVHLHLTVQEPIVYPQEKATFCPGDPSFAYSWVGHEGRTCTRWVNGVSVGKVSVITEAGTYRDTVFYNTLNSSGTYCPKECYELVLTENEIFNLSDEAIVCENTLPYIWKGTDANGPFAVILTQAGDKDTTLTSVITGCDSVVTFSLTVLPVYKETEKFSVCEDELPYMWKGTDANGPFAVILTQAGDKDTTLTSIITGCDSIVTFTLSVIQIDSVMVTDIFCEGDTYQFADTLIADAGTYIHRFAREGKCDSVVTLVLDRHPAPVTLPLEMATVVPGGTYTWLGHGDRYAALSADSTYADTVRYATSGCDSAYYTLRLYVVSPMLRMEVSADTACAGDPAFTLRLRTLEGVPATCDILFDESAHSRHLSDTLALPLQAGVEENVVTVDLPVNATDSTDYLRPDNYGFTVRVYAAGGNTYDYPCSLAVLYPSWVLFQRWDDVLSVANEQYNGGYTFTAIRWYHDGKQIEEIYGDNGAYVYLPLAMGEPYWAELTRSDDGKTFRTCAFYPQPQNGQMSGQALHARLLPRRDADSRQAQIEADAEGRYMVYDFAGRAVMSGVFRFSDTDLQFPSSAAEGTYLVFFRADDGRTAACRWIVQ